MTQYNHNRERSPQRTTPDVTYQPQIDALLRKIVFSRSDMPKDIFSDIAEEAAKIVKNGTNKNKRTQLRRFYDELVMWNDSVQMVKQRAEKYDELAPFIKMLKAKAAYAKGRDHVDEKFEKIFSHCINKIENHETLLYCKLFMEAFMGYYRALENKS
ncbi:MAG: type III-A CRISPR-associated protein Csm2 [Deltaproteobacteria bacterium]|jgi:CRISPR-associated protein Csm2|nr:type III-A CRISPR-associated protein Csm2 [Deltaproteobacteria bacterium]